jgi:predicted DNA-binding ArsR family transcriptional regulator
MIKRRYKPRTKLGSALILAVVLTSLLAIIGVMFIMMARVDKMATSAVSENRELNFAVETVVARISQELVLDVPGMPKGKKDYYDYPDANNAWLASLEPYEKTAGNYYWRQISDVTGYLNDKEFSTQNVNVKPVGLSTTVYVREYPEITLDGNGELKEQSADADGDGIADSKWIKLDNITSNKGKPIYAAIRIIDNGGMINVNTAYKFNPNETDPNLIDGSSQLQINLKALARGTSKIEDITKARNPKDRPLSEYERDVIWKIEDPCSDYLPFDISDELELRNRFFLTSLAKTRLEATWNSTIGSETFKRVPYDSNMASWFAKFDPNSNEPDRRHYLTTYNMDRIIKPDGKKMLNINDANVSSVYDEIIDANLNIANAKEVAAQIAVNLVDFRDSDSNVTSINVDGVRYYGFERPCVYISELAHRFVEPNIPISPLPINFIDRSYAIELYKPYREDDYPPEPNQWQLNIQGYGAFPINWSGTKYFHVMYFEDKSAPLAVNFAAGDADPNLPPWGPTRTFGPGNIVFSGGKNISLQRKVGGDWITVDSVTVPFPNNASGWLLPDPNGVAHSIKRDITPLKCIRRLWASAAEANSPTLGTYNGYFSSDPNVIQAHPEDKPFTNVGEIGMVFRKSAYAIGPADTETTTRLNLADPNYHGIFKYLTVFDPTVDGIDNDGDGYGAGANVDPNELKIPGRININTAPWYVIAQLPWVSQRRNGYDNTALAQAIVAYRDKLDLTSSGGPDYSGGTRDEGFENIGQLCNVISGSDDFRMDYYKRDSEDQKGFPDLTTPDQTSGDGAANDFEERDVIFARISNLVTVRSDVFTAYILVRIGDDGPQKRVMAILDRSNVYTGDDKVRIIALYPVPDPR